MSRRQNGLLRRWAERRPKLPRQRVEIERAGGLGYEPAELRLWTYEQPLARWHRMADGEWVALITSERWSVTSERHKGQAMWYGQQAKYRPEGYATVLLVPNIDEIAAPENAEHLQSEWERLHKRWVQARVHMWHWHAMIEEYAKTMLQYTKLTGIALDMEVPKALRVRLARRKLRGDELYYCSSQFRPPFGYPYSQY